MATQQITLQETNDAVVFSKPAVNKLVCMFVAGLLFTAMLYTKASTNSQPTCTPVNNTVSAGSCNNTKSTQSKDASSTFSLMPGGLSRFLQ